MSLQEIIVDLVEEFLSENSVMTQEDYDNILITANEQQLAKEGEEK